MSDARSMEQRLREFGQWLTGRHLVSPESASVCDEAALMIRSLKAQIAADHRHFRNAGDWYQRMMGTERQQPADTSLPCGCNEAVNHTCERHSTMPMQEKP